MLCLPSRRCDNGRSFQRPILQTRPLGVSMRKSYDEAIPGLKVMRLRWDIERVSAFPLTFRNMSFMDSEG